MSLGGLRMYLGTDERWRHTGAGGRGWSDPPLSMPGVPSRSSSSDKPMPSSGGRSLQSSNPWQEGHPDARDDRVQFPRGDGERPDGSSRRLEARTLAPRSRA